ncbi:MAG: papain-like cysteine protease family protein [Vicinamibacterales bacterium]
MAWTLPHRGAWLVALLIASGATPAAAPRADGTGQDGRPPLIDVPYLPQPEALCGGAAVAMVLRYWGDRDVYPADFSRLVDPVAQGIHANDLAAAVEGLGWSTHALGGEVTAADVRRQLTDGRPVVALIEDRPGVFHYIVVIGWRGDTVVAHDPARGPFREIAATDFERRWAAANHWSLLILPGEALASAGEPRGAGPAPAIATRPAPASPGDAGVCASRVDRGVALARAHALEAAAALLEDATAACPGDAAGWRELGAVRFLEKRWADAARLASRATRLSPLDEYSWRLLATSRYLDGDTGGALDAWNHLGEPTIDVVRIEGLRRTRHPVVDRALDLAPRATLTSGDLDRARHRLDALPATASSRVAYRLGEDGRAEVDVAVHERAAAPSSPWSLAALGGRALIARELRVDLASPTGSGELWSGAWRYWRERPRVAFGIALPSPGRLPGVTRIEAAWERQSYAGAGVRAPVRLSHRHAAARLSDWRTGVLRWEAGAVLDGWDGPSHAGLDGGLELRLGRDHVALGARAAAWAPAGDRAGFATAAVRAAWRSTGRRAAAGWSAVAGLASASAPAPLDLWPGAGVGHARSAFLRAHPLLDGGVLAGPVFGRRLAHASLEYARPIHRGAIGVALAVFGDAARAWARRDGTRSAWQVDTGAGLRITAPGIAGVIRLDLARGLADGQVAVSAGWQPPWPWP